MKSGVVSHDEKPNRNTPARRPFFFLIVDRSSPPSRLPVDHAPATHSHRKSIFTHGNVVCEFNSGGRSTLDNGPKSSRLLVLGGSDLSPRESERHVPLVGRHTPRSSSLSVGRTPTPIPISSLARSHQLLGKHAWQHLWKTIPMHQIAFCMAGSSLGELGRCPSCQHQSAQMRPDPARSRSSARVKPPWGSAPHGVLPGVPNKDFTLTHPHHPTHA